MPSKAGSHSPASSSVAPSVILSGPVLGVVVLSMLCVTTTLYLAHDREAKEWKRISNETASGYWPPPSGEFNWCEPDYVYTPLVTELWNSVTSLSFLVGPVLGWGRAKCWEVRLNLLLVAAIGLGSVVFHATLQYEGQLLDEVPMICYIVHTVALLARKDVSCPIALKVAMVLLSVLLFSTPREAAIHEAGRVVMVLGFSSCFVWLSYSLATVCARLDAWAGGSAFYYTRRYQWASLTVLLAICAWVTDNLGCAVLHNLPFGLPYLHLHATVWHTGMRHSHRVRARGMCLAWQDSFAYLSNVQARVGMAFVCHCLCQTVLGKHDQSRQHTS